MSVTLTKILGALRGKTKDLVEEFLDLSVERDANGKGVLRTVDAAPFAYDSVSNKLNVNDTNSQSKLDALVNALANSDLTGKDADEMPIVSTAKTIGATTALKYLYPLQEANSRIAYDLAPADAADAKNALKFNIASLNLDGINSPRRVANFRSAGDSYVRLPKSCSIRNLSAFTWFGIVDFKTFTGTPKKFFYESVANGTAAGRFSVQVANNLKLTTYVRSGTSSGEVLQFVSTASLPSGYHMLAITCDVATSTLKVYVDGVEITGTVTGSLTPDTKIADTAPQGQIYIGAGCDTATTPLIPTYNLGGIVYVGLFEGVLTAANIQDLAIAGGYMSLDRV